MGGIRSRRYGSVLSCSAKKHISGKILQLVFCVLYAIVALGFKYYGEAITYIEMTFPIDLFATIVWLKNPSEKGKTEVRMAHLTPKKIRTASVFKSMMASVLTIMRVPYYALAYTANDIILIIMWIMASVENPVYVPMIFNFVIFLVNDTYGFLSWKNLLVIFVPFMRQCHHRA